mmetsp:Transcript_6655/g.9586  ORF Transcript_6655/g.9586 Transcript_6655/m.9586 type:complete len:92 (+) Transcript_6655:143-418(+)
MMLRVLSLMVLGAGQDEGEKKLFLCNKEDQGKKGNMHHSIIIIHPTVRDLISTNMIANSLATFDGELNINSSSSNDEGTISSLSNQSNFAV